MAFTDVIKKDVDRIGKSLPAHVQYDRFMKSAQIAYYKNPKLQVCSPESIVEAIYTAAQLGLDFIPARGHASLVPFKGEAKFIPGWRGLVDLAKRSPSVKKIESRVVYESDVIEIKYGSQPILHHTPSMNPDRTKGKIVGAYAVAFLDGGVTQFEYMDFAQLESVRKVSKNADGQVYKDWEDEMRRKAPVRRLCKFMPSNPDLDKAIAADNQMYEINPEAQPMELPDMTPEKEIRTLNPEPETDNLDYKQLNIQQAELRKAVNLSPVELSAVGVREKWDHPEKSHKTNAWKEQAIEWLTEIKKLKEHSETHEWTEDEMKERLHKFEERLQRKVDQLTDLPLYEARLLLIDVLKETAIDPDSPEGAEGSLFNQPEA